MNLKYNCFQINSLKARLQQSCDEVLDLREELAQTKQANEQLVSGLKEETLSYQEKLSQESSKSKNVEGDRELLRTQIVDLRKVSQCSHYRGNVTHGGGGGVEERGARIVRVTWSCLGPRLLI